MPAWILRSYNCKDNLKDVKTGLKTVNHGTVVLESLWWPGQNVFYNNGRVMSVYCGDGHKKELPRSKFYPVQTPVMMQDRAEKKCCEEPNPTQAWLDAKFAAQQNKEAQPKEDE